VLSQNTTCFALQASNCLTNQQPGLSVTLIQSVLIAVDAGCVSDITTATTLSPTTLSSAVPSTTTTTTTAPLPTTVAASNASTPAGGT